MSIMNTVNETNLKKVLKAVPDNAIITSKQLAEDGVYYDLQRIYERNGWLKRVAQGAYVKLDQKHTLDGAVYALQSQLGLSIHIGGITALSEKHGKAHNIAFNREKQLFGYRDEKLPKWFKSLYGNECKLNATTFLSKDLGLVAIDNGNFKTQISTPERAILEMLYCVPNKAGVNEAYQVMELLVSLKPTDMQELLENCSSIKVKRLFLYMSERAGHTWLKRLDLNKIDLGKGVREIVKGGTLDKKYNIIIGSIEE